MGLRIQDRTLKLCTIYSVGFHAFTTSINYYPAKYVRDFEQITQIFQNSYISFLLPNIGYYVSLHNGKHSPAIIVHKKCHLF